MDGLRAIYYKEIDVHTEIETHIFEETLRRFNLATAKGLAESIDPEVVTDRFLYELRTNNAVFSAFRTHRMQNDIAAQLIDRETGRLKSFDKWKRDIKGMTDHYCHQWLQTEYDTAIIRAHQAADWKHFLEEQDVFPNVRWMPTTSITPDPLHEHYWTKKLTLPVNHPFWQEHRPGDRWNCKCSLMQTDEPVNAEALDGYTPPLPMPGLDNNPAEDGALFSKSHPYFTEAFPGAEEATRKAVESIAKKRVKTEEEKRKIMTEWRERKIDRMRELYQKYKDSPDYENVVFDEKTGAIKANSVNHNKKSPSKDETFFGDKLTSTDLEIECQSELFRMGYSCILEAEGITGPHQNNPKTSLDTTTEWRRMDIRSITAPVVNYRNAILAKNKQIIKFNDLSPEVRADSMILYFHDPMMYSEDKVIDGYEKAKKFHVPGQTNPVDMQIKHIICVVKGEADWHVFDFD